VSYIRTITIIDWLKNIFFQTKNLIKICNVSELEGLFKVVLTFEVC